MESVQPDPCVQHLPYFIAVREVDCSVPGVWPCSVVAVAVRNMDPIQGRMSNGTSEHRVS